MNPTRNHIIRKRLDDHFLREIGIAASTPEPQWWWDRADDFGTLAILGWGWPLENPHADDDPTVHRFLVPYLPGDHRPADHRAVGRGARRLPDADPVRRRPPPSLLRRLPRRRHTPPCRRRRTQGGHAGAAPVPARRVGDGCAPPCDRRNAMNDRVLGESFSRFLVISSAPVAC